MLNTNFKDKVYLILNQFLKLLTGLVRNKLVAIFYGSSGIGFLSLYQVLTDLITQFSMMGTDKLVVTEGARKKKDISTIQSQYLIVIACNFILSIVFIFLFKSYLPSGTRWEYLITFSFVNVMSVFNMAVINGIGKIKLMIKYQFYSLVVSNILLLCFFFFLDSEISHVPWLVILTTFPSFIIFSKIKYSHGVKFLFVNGSFKKDIYKKGFYVASGAFLMLFFEFLSKVLLTQKYSLSELGFYQAALTLLNLLPTLLLGSLATKYLPSISNTTNDKEVYKVVNGEIEQSLLICSIPLLTLIAFSKEFLGILYSDDFIVASRIVAFTSIGIILKMVTYPLNYALIAKDENKTYFNTQFFFHTANFFLFILTVFLIGFDFLGLSYSLCYMFYFYFLVNISSKKLNVKLSRNTKKLILNIILIALILIVLTINEYNSNYIVFIKVFFILSFFMISIKNFKRLTNEF
ncbi:oligosaccharide flippase family protein [Vibrio campbellii]|uniref:oligosaccharide flippase family protein n=1 Tax=Vibrio campbellii TaxID=680 RepID=UPI001F2091D3|nr:oligosaccharide flippase family protein [Vibrio campbellii]MCE7728143.1 oligosaccharide flippase family protein [Vibrio campbellii]